MKKYTRKELIELLEIVDRQISYPVQLIIIGDSAAVLKYRVENATKDIDYIDDSPSFRHAIEEANLSTKLSVPFEKVTVHDGPYHFTDRIVSADVSNLKNLKIFYPEIHDLILMKSIRGNENDFDMIREICKKNRIDVSVLKERIDNEMDHVIGNPERLKLQYEICLEIAEEFS